MGKMTLYHTLRDILRHLATFCDHFRHSLHLIYEMAENLIKHHKASMLRHKAALSTMYDNFMTHSGSSPSSRHLLDFSPVLT